MVGKTVLLLKSFTVTIDQPENGSIKLDPALPADGKYPEGTVITISATPDPGYAFYGGYYAMPGRWGKMYYESMTPSFKVVVDHDKSVGASFIEKEKLEGFKVIQNVVYAQPGVKKLKYDVYTPDGAKNLPCIVIIHGGGWATNTEDIMRGLARELVRGGGYVVFSIDYRWVGKLDGDKEGNTMADLNHFSDNPAAGQSWKDAVSPINFIPNVKERAVPQFLTRGTLDPLIKDEMVKTYADALKAAGQTVKYVQVEGASHAFFDWKPDARTKATFEKFGVPYAAQMKEFFNTVFYPKK